MTVTISGHTGTQDSLSFSTSNWSSPQTVTVTARDDADALTDPAVTLTHSRRLAITAHRGPDNHR